MIEIRGGMVYFLGEAGKVLACMEVPVKLEFYGQVVIVIDFRALPSSAQAATHFQIALPMPVMYGAEAKTVMLTSQLIPIKTEAA